MSEPRPSLAPAPPPPALVVGGVLLLLTVMAAAYAVGTGGRVASPERWWTPEPIDRVPAPLFTLPSLRGADQVELQSLRGQVVVLNFFASWCVPCALEASDLQRAWRASRDRGVTFVGIAVQDEALAARAFLVRHGVAYPAAYDRDGSVMQAYNVNGIPTTVFIDPVGRIAGRHAGIFVGDAGVARLRARIDAARTPGR